MSEIQFPSDCSSTGSGYSIAPGTWNQELHQWTPLPSLYDFDYKSLPLSEEETIRLLHIQRNRINKTSRFTLIACKLKEAPRYQAVSYVWGSNRRTSSLHFSNGRALWITHNLGVALEYVVPRCSTGYLWIDQICMLFTLKPARDHRY
jgi:heterokaryon incompatibility protein (HET)